MASSSPAASPSTLASWRDKLAKRLSGDREKSRERDAGGEKHRASPDPKRVPLPTKNEEWLIVDLAEMETAFNNGTDRIDGGVVSKKKASAKGISSSPSSGRTSGYLSSKSPRPARPSSPSPLSSPSNPQRKASAPSKLPGQGLRLDAHQNGRASPRSASPHRSNMKKKKSSVGGAGPSDLSSNAAQVAELENPTVLNDDGLPPDTSNFSKVRDTLRIRAAQKKKKKKGGAYSVPQYSPDLSFDQPASKYDDPFEARPNFTDSTEERRPGQDHSFEWVSVPHNKPEYCDHCGDLAWGFHRQVMKCTKCDFVVHRKCEQKVVIDCSTRIEQAVLHHDKMEESTAPEEEDEKEKADLEPTPIARSSSASSSASHHHLSSTSSSSSSSYTDHPDSTTSSTTSSHNLYANSEKAKLSRRIREYNRKTTPVHHIHIRSSHTPGQVDYNGFVRVHMCVQRPIHVSTAITRTSWYRLMRPVKERNALDTTDHGFETAFYLPTDTNRLVHILSTTTTKELIQILLKKFCVTDNPKKFSLYEEYGSDSRRLFEDDCPLKVVLEASCAHRNSKLMLRDNTYHTIQWEAFSLPELTNFIQILHREEDIYADRLKDRFKLWKSCISTVMKDRFMESASQQTQLNIDTMKKEREATTREPSTSNSSSKSLKKESIV